MSPTRDQIRHRLVTFLEEITRVAPEALTDDATFDSLTMDSIAFVELQVAIEEEWGIEIDAIEVVELNAFGPIVDYVHARVQDRVA